MLAVYTNAQRRIEMGKALCVVEKRLQVDLLLDTPRAQQFTDKSRTILIPCLDPDHEDEATHCNNM